MNKKKTKADPARNEPLIRPPRARDVFCNRTLNLRAIRAVGYDMDYTLVDYHSKAWELTAYQHIRSRLRDAGWPVEGFEFDSELVARGLVIDTERGNVVKANRFGYVKRAFHGTRQLSFDEQRQEYSRTIVDLSQERWVFLNTLFSLSEGCFYAQLVDLLDARRLPEVMGYADLYHRIRRTLDQAHMEGALKADITGAPEKFVRLDPETPLALLDQKAAGKKLMLVTNSEWSYTKFMMSFAFDRFLPKSKTWRDLFDVVIVGARKPDFFVQGSAPLFEVVSEDGLLRPSVGGLRLGGVFLGGCAPMVEKHLQLSGDEILYVGDHIWGDVRVSKSVLRWRTALVLAELEPEIAALEQFAPTQAKLDALMREKAEMEDRLCQLRLDLQRVRSGHGPSSGRRHSEIDRDIARLRDAMVALDEVIGPLAQAAGEVGHRRWGPLMRAGSDKSRLARQVEGYADIYTSRVSNLLFRTPYAFLRSHKGSLPHDAELGSPGAAPLEATSPGASR